MNKVEMTHPEPHSKALPEIAFELLMPTPSSFCKYKIRVIISKALLHILYTITVQDF